uniref:Uncharacterized protein n=1 Tax=Melopsittacus undulatus TaxID=13146 RepID=A0A8C6ITX5_MELUD
MKILLYKLWHLLFLCEALDITLLEHVQVMGTQFLASNTHALLLSVSLHSAVFPTENYYHVNSLFQCKINAFSIQVPKTILQIIFFKVTKSLF